MKQASPRKKGGVNRIERLNWQSWLLFSLLASVFLACQNEPDLPTKAYYYPLDGLHEGLVYEYRSLQQEADPPFYRYFRAMDQDTALYLTAMEYDLDYLPFQFVREEVVSNGAQQVDYFLYETDSTGFQNQIPVAVESGNVFSFDWKKEQVLFYQIKYSLPAEPGSVYTLIRNRQYISDTSWTYRGKTYDAMRIYVRELIDLEKDGHTEHEFDGEEIYAKGLGLVYYRKNVTNEFITEYHLVDRYPMEELEKRFGESQ